MNWSKAKTVLLVALVAVNIFLLGNYLHDRYRINNYEYTKDFTKETLEMLEEYNIAVDTEIPYGYTSLSNLQVSFESPSTQRLNQRYFKSEGRIEEPQDNVAIIRRDAEQLSIIDERRFLYERDNLAKGEEMSQQEAEAIAEDFLQARDYDTEDLKLVDAQKDQAKWNLSYTMVYNEHYVESAYTNFTIGNGKVLFMDRLWIDVRQVSDNEQIIVPAAKVLLSLLDQSEYYGKTIVKIDPCYYFNPEEQAAVENLTRALHGRATPAWRIEFDDGTELVLDS